jgi:murein DD-endopeptidase MepM/ murein hydrolase activator NlpD
VPARILAPARILGRFVCVLRVAWVSAGFVAPAAAAARGRWQQPVAGPVTRAFDYAGNPFAAGRHRGADFAARPGAPVRSACAGRVVFAGTAGANGPTVSVRCGPWRVAYLPLRTLAVRRGARVARGAPLGTAAGSGRHAGLHVGVRREGWRWGYVDPLPFFGASAQPPLAPAPRPLRRPPSSRPVEAPRPGLLRRPSREPRPTRLRHPVVAPARPQWPVDVAPWPAWAGLALVLAGVSGAGLARRRRTSSPRTAPVMARVARE